MDFITWKHSMPAGDLLSVLPMLKQAHELTGKKSIIYQRVNLEYGDMFGAYAGANYSIRDERGTAVTMNKAVFDALVPLLRLRQYIQDFREWDGESVDYDLDVLRQQDTTMPYGSINRWGFYLFPDLACDLSKPWIEFAPYSGEPDMIGKILINRTERYNNMLISYRFLRKYGDNVVFVGLPQEHEIFCRQNGLDIKRYEAENFLEIAAAMRGCSMFIGVQSACFQIAEGMKIPRILEVCKQMPNVIGSGPGFYDFLHQAALEYYVDKLFNE